MSPSCLPAPPRRKRAGRGVRRMIVRTRESLRKQEGNTLEMSLSLAGDPSAGAVGGSEWPVARRARNRCARVGWPGYRPKSRSTATHGLVAHATNHTLPVDQKFGGGRGGAGVAGIDGGAFGDEHLRGHAADLGDVHVAAG